MAPVQLVRMTLGFLRTWASGASETQNDMEIVWFIPYEETNHKNKNTQTNIKTKTKQSNKKKQSIKESKLVSSLLVSFFLENVTLARMSCYSGLLTMVIF